MNKEEQQARDFFRKRIQLCESEGCDFDTTTFPNYKVVTELWYDSCIDRDTCSVDEDTGEIFGETEALKEAFKEFIDGEEESGTWNEMETKWLKGADLGISVSLFARE